jgi:hypothetical protein
MGEINMELYSNRIYNHFNLRDIPTNFNLHFIYYIKIDLIFIIMEYKMMKSIYNNIIGYRME